MAVPGAELGEQAPVKPGLLWLKTAAHPTQGAHAPMCHCCHQEQLSV